MHGLIEISQVIVDKKRNFEILKYFFIKSVLHVLTLSEERSPSFEQIEEGRGYMK